MLNRPEENKTNAPLPPQSEDISGDGFDVEIITKRTICGINYAHIRITKPNGTIFGCSYPISQMERQLLKDVKMTKPISDSILTKD